MNENTQMMNPFANEQEQGIRPSGVTQAMAVSREAQEVQASMIVAKQFPRDEITAFNRAMKACDRPTLAMQAIYEFPRGGAKVTGPSIHLARALAQAWGNVETGVIEMESTSTSTKMMAFCWDLETNTRQVKMFDVPHIRHTKKGDYPLTDPRDIYEMCANMGARRQRACILSVIPGDVVDAAIEECEKTLKGQSKEPLIDRVRKMSKMFEEQFGVPLTSLEAYCGCNSDAFSEQDFIKLAKAYNSLKSGMAKREDIFDLTAGKDSPTKEAPEKPNKPAPKKNGAKATPAIPGEPPAPVSLADIQ